MKVLGTVRGGGGIDLQKGVGGEYHEENGTRSRENRKGKIYTIESGGMSKNIPSGGG